MDVAMDVAIAMVLAVLKSR